MINNYLERVARQKFAFQPTIGQEKALHLLADFLLSADDRAAFILRGYAGTGKTSLLAAIVQTLDSMEMKSVLLAPTGRAAKVFSAYAEHPAYTIHRKIYRQQSFSAEMGNFSLTDNLTPHTLFVVDEASMIANEGLSGSNFGTGRLLDDLVQFVYSAEGCKLLLMGDTAQLPPIGEELSPALFAEALRGYGLSVTECELTEVVRQEEQSGILWNATRLRQALLTDNVYGLPTLRLTGFADIRVLPGNELIDTISQCYERDGLDETIVITRSNKRAGLYNNGIRARILWREEEVESGDLLMVAKNNYHYAAGRDDMAFIANGETAVVRRVRRERELYGFRFADVTLTFPDCNDAEIDATMLLDTLHTDTPALSREDNNRLFQQILEDYADLPTKRERMEKMKADPYYNALQVKYAYAVTCHKAQGGQWRNVFLDQGYVTEDMLTPDYYRWLYTAFTRATGTLYLLGYPKDKIV